MTAPTNIFADLPATRDAEQITTQVLFPSNALTIGLIREPEWAADLATQHGHLMPQHQNLRVLRS